ncbi:MAG TPA: class I SAM-dependent DNA methyltransferase, partial [Bacteroidales bacterium]|nr:class I SAM-dependent DNA methyltransferase [Bacteroidales bacterium]
MTSKEIEANLIKLTEKQINDEFIYDFLLAYGISKSSVTRLKKGDFNMSRVEGEVLYKGKILFKKADTDNILYEVERLANDERILKQNPRFVMLTDNETIAARDLKLRYNKEFYFHELPQNFEFFLPLIGGEIYKQSNNNEADRNAAYELAKLYDILIEDNSALKEGHTHLLNVFLARLLFCFFAEDTGIFEEGIFTKALRLHTGDDGANVHTLMNDLFRKLNSNGGVHPAYVQHFPYVNGGLFREEIDTPRFSRKSRNILLNCSELNWSEINPDIFGSMIQAVADPEERSGLGMHYTSVENILKVIRPLFLDELYEEFEKNRDNEKALRRLIGRMGKIKFFDPACGSGNFLIITYKEIRLLEINIIQRLIELEAEKRGEKNRRAVIRRRFG